MFRMIIPFIIHIFATEKNDNESFVSFVRFLFNNASIYMNQLRNYNSLDRTST